MALRFLNSGYFAGSVGIGTASPSYKLDISGTGSENRIRLQETTDNTAVTFLEVENSNNASGTFGVGGSGRTDILDNRAFVNSQSGTDGLAIGTEGTDPIVFYTQGVATGDEKMRIDSTGNVGIGTTSPGAKFTTSGVIMAIANDNAYNAGYFAKLSSDHGANSLRLTSRTGDVFLASNYGASVTLQVGNPNVPALYINANKTVQFNGYDSTNQTGTPTYLLGTDASGNIVKTNTVPGSAAGPYLPLAGGTMVGTTNHNDNVYSRWGTGADLRIWHNGTNSYVFNYGGNLYLGTGDADKDTVFLGDDGSGGETTYFYLDGSEGLNRFSKNVLLPDNVSISLGSAFDLQMYHDGSNSYIKDTGTGTLNLQGSTQVIIGGTNGEVGVQYVENAGVGLRHNNVTKLTTESTGINVAGDIQIDSALLSNQENTDVDTGTETVASVVIATYTAAFFDFVIKKTTNVRSGTVYACHDGTNVEFTETSTNDLGDTSDVTLSVDISGTNMRLLATVTSDDWSVKSLIRAI